MKRLFNRHVLVRAFAALIVLSVLFVVIENWTGSRALAAATEKLQAEGETLDFTAVLPHPLPDELNFCAIEPLAGLSDSNPKPAESLKALDWTILSIEGLGSIRSASAPDLQPLTAHLAARGIGKEDASPAEMLAALDAAHPLLKSLSDTASQRPAAQFLPRIGKGRPDIKHHEIDYTHFTQTQNLAKALLYRSNLAISAGNAGEALNGILGSLRLAEAHLQEPILLGLLVGSTIQSMAMDRVWALLHARIASGSELANLQKNIARLDLLAALLQASRGELAVTAHTLAALRARPELRSRLFGGPPNGLDEAQETSWVDALLSKFLPVGFYGHSEANLMVVSLDHLILPMKNGDFQKLSPALTALDKQIIENRSLTRPHYWLSAFSMGTYSSMICRAAESETRRRHALAAIAIERIRQTTGSPPASLPQGHLDFIDGKPMRYHLEGSGYMLWSIGLDNEDDGGKAPEPKDYPRSATYSGDWVWQMPAGH